MDKLYVIEIILTARCGRNVWVGEAYMHCPTGAEEVASVVTDVYNVAGDDLRQMNDLGKQIFVKVKAIPHTLRGPLAAKMQKHLEAVAGNHKPMFSWTPAKLAIWTVEDHPRG